MSKRILVTVGTRPEAIKMAPVIRALQADPAFAAPMALTFLLLAAVPVLGRRLPPLIGALVVGTACMVGLGRLKEAAFDGFHLIHPVVLTPVWSLPAMIELVVPLARAGIAVGADGVIVDVHPHPEMALCDGPQALVGADLDELAAACRDLPPLVGRRLVPAP